MTSLFEYNGESWPVERNYLGRRYQTGYKWAGEQEFYTLGIYFGTHTYCLGQYPAPHENCEYWLVHVPGYQYWVGIGCDWSYAPAELGIWRAPLASPGRVEPVLTFRIGRRRRALEKFLRKVLEALASGEILLNLLPDDFDPAE